MAGYVVFGDVEAAIIDVVRASAGVVAFTGVTVSTDRIGYTVPDRWVTVRRTGGVPTLWMQLDNALITLETLAGDKATALDLAEATRGAVFAGRGFVGYGLSLYDMTDVTGLMWSPEDAQPDVARYEYTLSVVTRPA